MIQSLRQAKTLIQEAEEEMRLRLATGKKVSDTSLRQLKVIMPELEELIRVTTLLSYMVETIA